MEELDELMMKEANTMCCAMGDTDNSFGRMLAAGEKFKSMGLTPLYLFDPNTVTVQCEIKETYGKKLN